MITWDADKGPTDEQVDDAMRVLRADYWHSVRGIAESLKARIASGELASSEDVTDAIHEDCDGSYWTIYTHANYRAILASDHDPWEDVEDSRCDLDPKNAMPVLAFYCLRHDVTAEIGDVDDLIEEREASARERDAEDET